LTIANGPEGAVDPDLARVVNAWSTLPAPLRRAVLALAGGHRPGRRVVAQLEKVRLFA
jgi:hypothetical protein